MIRDISRTDLKRPGKFTRLKNGVTRVNRGLNPIVNGVAAIQRGVTPAINRGANAFNKFANIPKIGGAMMAADLLLTGYHADATYDPTVHDNRINEFGKNFIANNVAEFGVAGTLGLASKFFKSPALAAVGMGVGVASMALSMSGFGPGEFIKRKMDTMGREFDNEKYGRGPIRQNEQTLRATSQNMQLLGQAGFGGNEVINPQSFAARKRGLLGSEAMLMHN